MVHTQKEIIKALEEANLIIKVGQKYVISKKLSNLVVERNPKTAKNIPKSLQGLSDNALYIKVMELCEIPAYGTVGFHRYHLRSMDNESLIVLRSIYDNPDIDFQRFLDRVKAYYADEELSQKSFAKLLKDGEWEVVYSEDKDEQEQEKGVY